MTYVIDFTDEAKATLAKYKKSNQPLFKKFSRVLAELIDHPRTGTGHPEPLVGGNSVTYSRRITGQHRLIYDIYEEKITVLVISVEGHYKDK